MPKHCAPWTAAMPPAEQIWLAGALLIIGDIKDRNPGVYDDVDEVAIGESSDPETARALATSIAARYRDHGEAAESDRLLSLCDQIASIIDKHRAG